jgi:hypothetical protein
MWKPLEEFFEDEEQVSALKKAIQYVFNPDINGVNATLGKTSPQNDEVVKSMERILRENDRFTIFTESQKLSGIVHDMFDAKFELFKESMEKLLGMDFRPIQYSFFDERFNQQVEFEVQQTEGTNPVFQVYKCVPVIRHNSLNGNASKLLIVTFLQKAKIDLKNTLYQGYLPEDKYEMRGGGTLLIDLATYEIKYAIIKNVGSSNRLKNQLDYAMENLYDAENAALLMQEAEPFSALHSH